MLLAETGYDVSHVPYLVDWSLKPPSKLLDDEFMLQYFREKAMLTQTLFRLTLFKIRKVLRDNISEQATQLPLPKSIIAAVQLKDELT